jgi:hypothetical protein
LLLLSELTANGVDLEERKLIVAAQLDHDLDPSLFLLGGVAEPIRTGPHSQPASDLSGGLD